MSHFAAARSVPLLTRGDYDWCVATWPCGLRDRNIFRERHSSTLALLLDERAWVLSAPDDESTARLLWRRLIESRRRRSAGDPDACIETVADTHDASATALLTELGFVAVQPWSVVLGCVIGEAPAVPACAPYRVVDARLVDAAAWSLAHGAVFSLNPLRPAQVTSFRGRASYRAELDLSVVEEQGAVAAFAIGWFDPQTLDVWIEPLGTTPKHRKRGLARVLVRELVARSCALGAKRVVLAVEPGNVEARALYRSEGFAELGEQTLWQRWV